MHYLKSSFIVALIFFGACNDDQSTSESSQNTTISDTEQVPNDSGMKTMTSDSRERSYYLKLPQGYNDSTTYPLIIAFHGTGGDSSRYTENEYYNLHGVVGEQAILVYPNALSAEGNEPQWNYTSDLEFFDDLVATLKQTIHFDQRQLFVVGHSSGAGFAQQIACQRGNIVRAVAAVAGAFMDDNNCRGEVAMILIQGLTDTMVPPSTVIPGRNYWVSYNGCDDNSTVEVWPSPCLEYTACDTDFPVRYCEHEEEDPKRHGGHAWPSFAGQAIWSFFKELTIVEPSDTPGSGAEEATLTGLVVPITFTVSYSADFSPPPAYIGLALGPFGSQQPITEFPLYLLTTKKITIDDYDIGGMTQYTIDANFTDVIIPGEYTLGVVIFVKGNTWPIPTFGRDYVGLQDISLENYNPIVIDEPFELEVIEFPF